MASAANLRNRSRALLLFSAVVLLLSSCDGSLVHSYRSTGGEWHRNDTLVFTNTLLYKEVSSMELYAGVRCSAAYPYKDLWLQVELLCGDSATVVLRDTVQCAIYDTDGRHHGTTAGTLYQSEHFVTSLELPHNTPFDVRITHLMGDTLLRGVYDVGIRLASPCRHQSEGR